MELIKNGHIIDDVELEKKRLLTKLLIRQSWMRNFLLPFGRLTVTRTHSPIGQTTPLTETALHVCAKAR